MISNVDKLLLSSLQQAEVERMRQQYNRAYQAGDKAAMNAAHRRAEEIRATAGYSGGENGESYQLLKVAGTPAGYNAYASILEDTVNTGMNAIAGGLESQLESLDQQRKQIRAENERNMAGARSAAWNQQRLAEDGLLTRGYANTGIADVVTATALNQAAANAYQALLDAQNDLAENDLARSEAEAEARSQAADLQSELGQLLGDAYLKLYDSETELSADLKKMAQDYYYQLALQKLKLQAK